MTTIKDKIQNGLDESRMLVLGAQILIGFAFTATFESGFPNLSNRSQHLNLVALTLLLITVCLLISPAAFHQLREKGKDSVNLHRFTTHIMEAALFPFALGIGAGIYIPAEEIRGTTSAEFLAVATSSVALVCWYGPVLLRTKQKNNRRKERSMNLDEQQSDPRTSVHDKIRQVLTEARVILPGNQALLGFQFAVILQQGFRELPQAVKLVHLVCLSLMALSTILLLSPAPYHRIVEHGEETDRFYQIANGLILSALPPMAVGIGGDFFVVVYKMTGRWILSAACALFMLSLFGGLWFGYALFRKNHQVQQFRETT